MPESSRPSMGNGGAKKEDKSEKDEKPPNKEVLVLALGSHALRYGRATDNTPRKLPAYVAFPRKDAQGASNQPPVRPHATPPRSVTEQFRNCCDEVAGKLDLDERRIGGGRPIPWEVECEMNVRRAHEDEKKALKASAGSVLVGRDALEVLEDDRAALYDVVAPIWDGKLVFGLTNAADTLVREAFAHLIDYIARDVYGATTQGAANGVPNGMSDPAESQELTEPNGVEGGKSSLPDEDPKSIPGKPSTSISTSKRRHSDKGEKKKGGRYVALVIPDTSDRSDVAEYVHAIFESAQLNASAIFLHQSSVSCALGAGLATCTVVDIGHSATTVACVEDGAISAESRAHLRYGANAMHAAFHSLLSENEQFKEVVQAVGAIEARHIAARSAEQVCTFKSDENDRLASATVPLRTSQGVIGSVRIKCGLAYRVLPAHGLLEPKLLKSVVGEKLPRRSLNFRNTPDDTYLDRLHREIKRNATSSAAVPIGTFAENFDQSIVDAVLNAAIRATQVVPATSSTVARFLAAVVLSGGGASLEGIAPALERRLKALATERGVQLNEVTVIDGGKGKGDEELAAATALLARRAGKERVEAMPIDDTDTASLPWKGGAVMVESDAVKEYWVMEEEWLRRGVRVLREKVPFYW